MFTNQISRWYHERFQRY